MISRSVLLSLTGIIVADALLVLVEDGRCQDDLDCPESSCCSDYGYCGYGENYCVERFSLNIGASYKSRTSRIKDCKKNYATIQFENIWQKDLLELAENGFAKKFDYKKFDEEIHVAVIGGGPAGLASAYELAKFAAQTGSRLCITIIENEKRLGGRIKTVGSTSNFMPHLWKGKAFTEAGAMRVPLTPQEEINCRYESECSRNNVNCDIKSLSDEEIENLVHGKGGYDFVQASSFPHYLFRHYVRKFHIPVFRHNFRTTAHEIDGKLFVRKNNNLRVCEACGRNNEDLNIDEYLLSKVDHVDRNFATKLRQFYNGSLATAYKMNVDQEVIDWIKNHTAIKLIDPSKTEEKLKAWEEFQKDWASTFRDHLLGKGWSEDVIDIYESAYVANFEERIRDEIVEVVLGKFWQKNGMFSLAQGMYSLIRVPEDKKNVCKEQTAFYDEIMKLTSNHKKNIKEQTAFYDEIIKLTSNHKKNISKEQTAFYDEIMKLTSNHENIRVNLRLNTKVEKIKKVGPKVTLYEAAKESVDIYKRLGTFDAVISTIPTNFLRLVDITDGNETLTPSDGLFKTVAALKMMLQFNDSFWLDSRNNLGGFDITDEQGFLTSSKVVAQLRYPRRSKEPGNIVMMYIYYENAKAFAHKIAEQGYYHENRPNYEDQGIKEAIDMALEQLQSLHPGVNVKRKFIGHYFVQPWVQLSRLPSGYHKMKKIQKYCNLSPKGIYFAGDGFSFKPQWMEGAFSTAYHAIYRLINDFTGAGKEDPFRIITREE